MKQIDLHGMTWAEAREVVVEAYNESVQDGSFDTLDIVHGYGASGQGGKMRLALRTFLTTHGVFFHSGETLDRNPGHTLVVPEVPLPGVPDRLQMDVLRYCETPKTREQIAGKYRRSGAPAVDAAIKALVGSKMLRVINEGKVRKYAAG
ncbi:MAG TPA: Smr/MutS family protein [Armatimonadota bacterium]|jgi:hypothetical protein